MAEPSAAPLAEASKAKLEAETDIPQHPTGIELKTFGVKTEHRRREATRPYASTSSGGANNIDWAWAHV